MLLSSKPALWLALITSGEFGFERDVIEKSTIDEMVVPPFEGFTTADRREIDSLFTSLVRVSKDAWHNIDAWVARLYGLKSRDLDVISDTLDYSLPFTDNRKSAQDVPTSEAVRLFCSTLNSELEAWGSRFGKRLIAEQVPLSSVSPWRTLKLCVHDALEECSKTASQPWFEFFKAADHMAASEIIFEDSLSKCIWIGRLDQARYWTQTRARLVAREMIWEHPNFLANGRE